MATRTQYHGLDVHHVPAFYSAERSAEIIEHLKTVEYNSEEESKVQVYGKWYNIPRQQTAYGDTGTSYSFSGNTVPARKWPQWLEDIRTELAEWLYENMSEIDWDSDDNITGAVPSFVLVNHYRNRNDKIGFHSDDEKDLIGLKNIETDKQETVIMSLSFGVTRDFTFQHKNAKAMKRSFMLRNGDLCVMRGDTQKTWKHSILEGLPEGKFDGETSRWNLTFRWMKTSNSPSTPKITVVKTTIEVGMHVWDFEEKEYEVISVTKSGTPRVALIGAPKSNYKVMHWSPKNHCWQLWGKPIAKWTST